MSDAAHNDDSHNNEQTRNDEPPPAENQTTVGVEEHHAAADDDDDDPDIQKYSMTSDLYEALKAIGFSDLAFKKSIIAGCVDAKTCQTWIEMHLDHPELEAPLDANIRFKVREKVVLTEEQRAAKVAELKAKIEKQKQQEAIAEVERNRQAEKARMEMGKLAREAEDERKARERQQAYEERKKEKERDRLAKEKVLFEMRIDKLMRGGRSREEATVIAKEEQEQKRREALENAKKMHEEAAAQRAQEEKEAKEEKSSSGGGGWDLSKVLQNAGGWNEEKAAPSKAQGGAAPSRQAGSLQGDLDAKVDLPKPNKEGFTQLLLQSNDLAISQGNLEGFKACIATLRMILSNTTSQPMEPKVRTIRVNSGVFTQKIAPIPLACAFLRLAGFQEEYVQKPGGEMDRTFSMAFLSFQKVNAAIAALGEMEAMLAQ